MAKGVVAALRRPTLVSAPRRHVPARRLRRHPELGLRVLGHQVVRLRRRPGLGQTRRRLPPRLRALATAELHPDARRRPTPHVDVPSEPAQDHRGEGERRRRDRLAPPRDPRHRRVRAWLRLQRRPRTTTRSTRPASTSSRLTSLAGRRRSSSPSEGSRSPASSDRDNKCSRRSNDASMTATSAVKESPTQIPAE